MLTQVLNQEVPSYKSEQKERLSDALQRMLSTSSIDENDENDVKSLTESYHKYKGEYVKHLEFNPANESLSKCF